jgi:hypothetical protein
VKDRDLVACVVRDFLQAKKVVFVVGAGISTESGIPVNSTASDHGCPLTRIGLSLQRQHIQK